MKVFNIRFSEPQKLQNTAFTRKDNVVKYNRMPNSGMVAFGCAEEGCPVLNYLKSDNYEFDSFTKRDLKNLPDVPCVYCGELMISVPRRTRLIYAMQNAKGMDLVKLLRDNERYLSSDKYLIAEQIISKARRYKDLNIKQLLQKLVPEHLPLLEEEQMAVLRKIEGLYLDSFSTQEQKDVFSMFLYDTYLWVHNEGKENNFKLKEFYNELHSLLCIPIFSDRSLNSRILKTAKEMPQSMDSINAFIVKYASREIPEIVSQLFHDALISIEHIKPQTSGGKNELSNYSLAHTSCNKNRSHIPMKEFAKINRRQDFWKVVK